MSPLVVKVYDPARPKRASPISEQEWVTRKPYIRRMHEQGLTRAEMLKILKREHKFSPSMGQLVARLGRWSLHVHPKPLILQQPVHTKTYFDAGNVDQCRSVLQQKQIPAPAQGVRLKVNDSPPNLYVSCGASNDCETPSNANSENHSNTIDHASTMKNKSTRESDGETMYRIGRDLAIPLPWRSLALQIPVQSFFAGMSFLADVLAIGGNTTVALHIYNYLMICLPELSELPLLCHPSIFGFQQTRVELSATYSVHRNALDHDERDSQSKDQGELPNDDTDSEMQIASFWSRLSHPESTLSLNAMAHLGSCDLLELYIRHLRAWLFFITCVKYRVIRRMLEDATKRDDFLVRILGFLLSVWQNHGVMLRETVKLSCRECNSVLSPYARSYDLRILVALIFGSVRSTNSMPTGFSAHTIINMLTRLHIDAFQESDPQWQRLVSWIHMFRMSIRGCTLFDDAETSSIELTQIARLGAGSALHTGGAGSSASDVQFTSTELALLRCILGRPRDAQLFELTYSIAWSQHAEFPLATAQASDLLPPVAPEEDLERSRSIHLKLDIDIQLDVSINASCNQVKNTLMRPQTFVTSVAAAPSLEGHKDEILDDAISICSVNSDSTSIRSFRQLAERISQTKRNGQRRGSFASTCMSLDLTSMWSFGHITGYASNASLPDEQLGVPPTTIVAGV